MIPYDTQYDRCLQPMINLYGLPQYCGRGARHMVGARPVCTLHMTERPIYFEYDLPHPHGTGGEWEFRVGRMWPLLSDSQEDDEQDHDQQDDDDSRHEVHLSC